MSEETLSIQNVLTRLMGTMSESALARAIKIPKATVNRILSGRTPDPRISTLAPIAEYFNVSIEQLLGKESLPKDCELADPEHRKNTLVLPYISIEEIDTEGKIHPTYSNTIHASKAQEGLTEHCYAIKVSGPAMEPKFHEGTIVIVNPELDAKHNDYVLTNMSDKGILFRQLIIDGNELYLSALNPKFELIKLTNKNQILGVVVESRLRL